MHKRTTDPQSPVDQKTAEDEIDRMYYRSGCSMEDTKTAILGALGVNSNVESDGWISLSMAIERDESMSNIQTSGGNKTGDDNMDTSNNASGEMLSSHYKETVDEKGIILEQVLRAGEGPAHSTEQWTTVIVPQWAVGKSFYFQCKNNSPLDLSCELSLDGEKVAFNAPVQANSTRTIRPDSVRYYQRHQWMLNGAKRVKLATVQNSVPRNNHDQTQAITPRYNGLRPDYAGQRISLEQYPDPTAYGWQFTGSVQESFVEFFEKQMNLGTVKMDFYYTTGTIKTVLHHPTGGKNQLFRAHVTPEQYVAILQNPRAHTGQGYRRREDRPAGNDNGNNQGGDEDDDEFDRVPSDPKKMDSEMEAEDGSGGEPGVGTTRTTYYARDNNYDFKRQGHRNRQEQMNKLQQNAGYTQWKEANKKEYAVIHAKFYVSIPKRMYHRAPPKPSSSGGGQRKGKQMTPLPVPEQKSVVDIKAAESCTLGTKYHITGPPQTMGRSRVRMERINGLTDDKASKGDAIFEQKLYYRAESIINDKGLNDDSDGGMNEDDDVEVNNSIPNVPLAAYKTEKIEQVKQYHSDLSGTIVDEEEVEQILRNTTNKIRCSESIQDVDESVNLFHKDLVHRQFESSSSNNNNNINNNSMDC